MLATVALISVMAAIAFLCVAYYFKDEIAMRIRPPQRVVIPVLTEEAIRRQRNQSR